MCGICGVYNQNGEPVSSSLLRRMTDAIAHRGPDGEGYFSEDGVGFGHRRLAIIDLSTAGDQPRITADGRYVITYNGEVYNFRELRAELKAKGIQFTSKTDTEVLINAYAEWGLDAISRLNGMFAFAIWDRQEKRLLLARDRFGVKPLYYSFQNGKLIFGSEIKAILQHPDMRVEVNQLALSEYFTFQNILSDLTLFDNIRLIPSGTIVSLSSESTSINYQRYWDFEFNSRDFELSFEETRDKLFQLFEQAVTRQLVADVPVGSYLSGGMDSGSITAVASRNIPRLHTFTGGFDLTSASGLELAFDERSASEVMANLFKSEHYEIVMHAGDMEYVLPKLTWHMEDLRVGQSYPNYYVARLASKFVKVVLSGTGGDELFAGYPWRYYRGQREKDISTYFEAYYNYWQRLIPDDARSSFFVPHIYNEMSDYHPKDVFGNVFAGIELELDDIEQLINASLYFESKTFLEGLFIMEDKLSMAHSLETRVPFLDNDLVDFATRIPPRYKLRELTKAPSIDEDEIGKRRKFNLSPISDGKIVLREAMKRLIPDEITESAKQGFAAPDASWFRGESIDYVNKLLKDSKANINDFVSSKYIATALEEHSSGRKNNRLLIWSLMSFEWWLRTFA